jgi:23S rRNA (guanine2445-N2)-methyltransferase / 23S rRNA (guanine2069-N7)-methyltransferase
VTVPGDGVTAAEVRQFHASAPRGLADLLARELIAFGAVDVRERSTGVAFRGSLETAYRACLWSRTANRVFLELGEWDAASAQEFYVAARKIEWTEHIGAGATLACDFSGRHPTIIHTHFGALKLKDAICDAVRDSAGYRPDVSIDRPSVRVHAHANRTKITVSLDLSGESLHRRSYRGAGGEAPLKENVAAGVLMRAGWPELAARGAEFLDPMCGSGTFVIEAALMAADLAPGLTRDYFGFLGWRGHDAPLWARLRAEATARARSGATVQSLIRGHDRDAAAIRVARDNAQGAGVDSFVQFAVQPVTEAAPGGDRATQVPQSASAAPLESRSEGLMCVNPPYGVRMEDREAARLAHRQVGDVLRARFKGWQAAVLTGAPDLGLEIGIRAHRTHAIWNGALECRLLRLQVEANSLRDRARAHVGPNIDASLSDSRGARMFANRLGKNLKKLQRWATAADVSCYRLYDADMPEYSLAIDCYRTHEEGENWLYVQEYAAPATVDEQAAHRRRSEALSVLPEVTGVPAERIRLRVRRRQTRGHQYEKMSERSRFHIVSESGLRFRVNFDDYLDTGLFLDHRPTRARLRAAARGKSFLNLFAYTGTATVCAAAGGARSSLSVDLSRTYLDWAERNLALNDIPSRGHTFVQADCRAWLEQAALGHERYDLIFLDPPTFSNSKRMEGVLDIGRDHAALIDACERVLAPDGLLVFSTNAQRFKLDPVLAARYDVRDISAATVPPDFARNPRIHRCFEIRRATAVTR